MLFRGVRARLRARARKMAPKPGNSREIAADARGGRQKRAESNCRRRDTLLPQARSTGPRKGGPAPRVVAPSRRGGPPGCRERVSGRGCCRRRRSPAPPSRLRERPGPQCVPSIRSHTRRQVHRPRSERVRGARFRQPPRRVVGNGANIGPIPGQSPSAAITFNLNTADKELTIASGSSLYGGAVRSDSNSGTIGVWNLNPNLFAGVALGAAGDTGTNQVVNQAGGSLGPSSLTGDGGNSFDNAGSTSGRDDADRRRHQRRHQPGRRQHERAGRPHRRRPEPRRQLGRLQQRPQDHRQRQQRDRQPRGGHDPVDLHRRPATAGTSSSTGERSTNGYTSTGRRSTCSSIAAASAPTSTSAAATTGSRSSTAT